MYKLVNILNNSTDCMLASYLRDQLPTFSKMYVCVHVVCAYVQITAVWFQMGRERNHFNKYIIYDT